MNTAFNKSIRRQAASALQRGMTLIEIMIVIIIMAMVATGVSIAVMRQLDKAKVKDARMGACAISSAVMLYIAENNECPTVDDIKDDLEKNKRVTDPWDNDYVIECEGDEPVVYSQGKDGSERLTCVEGKDEE